MVVSVKNSALPQLSLLNLNLGEVCPDASVVSHAYGMQLYKPQMCTHCCIPPADAKKMGTWLIAKFKSNYKSFYSILFPFKN